MFWQASLFNIWLEQLSRRLKILELLLRQSGQFCCTATTKGCCSAAGQNQCCPLTTSNQQTQSTCGTGKVGPFSCTSSGSFCCPTGNQGCCTADGQAQCKASCSAAPPPPTCPAFGPYYCGSSAFCCGSGSVGCCTGGATSCRAGSCAVAPPPPTNSCPGKAGPFHCGSNSDFCCPSGYKGCCPSNGQNSCKVSCSSSTTPQGGGGGGSSNTPSTKITPEHVVSPPPCLTNIAAGFTLRPHIQDSELVSFASLNVTQVQSWSRFRRGGTSSS